MSAGASNLVLRLATAAVAVPVILSLLYLAPPWAFYALVLPASLVATHELLAMTHPTDPVSRAIGVAVAATSSLVVYLFPDDPRLLLTLLISVPVVGPLVTLARLGKLETAALRACALGLAPLFVGVPPALLGLLLRKLGHAGPGAVLLALGLAWFTDTGAYFTGRFFGRRKLYEAVSPKKTVEGALGGVVSSLVWAVFCSLVLLHGSLPLAHALPLAVVGGSLGQAGDLAESLFKRSTGVKDSGAIVPGHGGVLDRIDSVLVTSVVVYLYAQWVWNTRIG
ncbi:MAG TPA: phosphatidate cytidylyltransferase [Polyangiaceae bacterium]|nr:phosphatidate cytidylyltransferase [Polyangiaceae bacterium]